MWSPNCKRIGLKRWSCPGRVRPIYSAWDPSDILPTVITMARLLDRRPSHCPHHPSYTGESGSRVVRRKRLRIGRGSIRVGIVLAVVRNTSRHICASIVIIPSSPRFIHQAGRAHVGLVLVDSRTDCCKEPSASYINSSGPVTDVTLRHVFSEYPKKGRIESGHCAPRNTSPRLVFLNNGPSAMRN